MFYSSTKIAGKSSEIEIGSCEIGVGGGLIFPGTARQGRCSQFASASHHFRRGAFCFLQMVQFLSPSASPLPEGHRDGVQRNGQLPGRFFYVLKGSPSHAPSPVSRLPSPVREPGLRRMHSIWGEHPKRSLGHWNIELIIYWVLTGPNPVISIKSWVALQIDH